MDDYFCKPLRAHMLCLFFHNRIWHSCYTFWHFYVLDHLGLSVKKSGTKDNLQKKKIAIFMVKSRHLISCSRNPLFVIYGQSYMYIPSTLNTDYLLWQTQFYSKILNHRLNHGLLFSLFKFFEWKNIQNLDSYFV